MNEDSKLEIISESKLKKRRKKKCCLNFCWQGESRSLSSSLRGYEPPTIFEIVDLSIAYQKLIHWFRRRIRFCPSIFGLHWDDIFSVRNRSLLFLELCFISESILLKDTVYSKFENLLQNFSLKSKPWLTRNVKSLAHLSHELSHLCTRNHILLCPAKLRIFFCSQHTWIHVYFHYWDAVWERYRSPIFYVSLFFLNAKSNFLVSSAAPRHLAV